MGHNAATTWGQDHSKLLLAMALTPSEVGLRIKQARDRKGWTQLEFALQANVSPSSVARWEAGKLPPLRELFRIAGLLEVEVDQLVEPDSLQTDSRLGELEARVDRNFEKVTEILERIETRIAELADSQVAVPKKSRVV